jgi:hypothetical protein
LKDATTMGRQGRWANAQAITKRPPFAPAKARSVYNLDDKWAVDKFVPVAAMMRHQPSIAERDDALCMARSAVQDAYEKGRQAADEAREWVEQRERLRTLWSDPGELAVALRKLDPRCLAFDRQPDLSGLLRRLTDGPAPSPAELREAVCALTKLRPGRPPDLFVDGFVRFLARWWRAVTGEDPPLMRNAAGAREPAGNRPPNFLDFVDAAGKDAGGSAVGLPTLTRAARRVGETIRSEQEEGRPGWVFEDGSWRPRFAGALF